MQLKERPALGNITTYITTTEPRPLEKSDQPQKSLGEIAFHTIHPKEDYQAAPKQERSRWEKAVLYFLEQTLEKMTKVQALHGEHSVGAHLYAALTGKNYTEWKEEAANVRERLWPAARSGAGGRWLGPAPPERRTSPRFPRLRR